MMVGAGLLVVGALVNAFGISNSAAKQEEQSKAPSVSA
jgi:F0F1-type ATP synthase membrane subunit c/vacuolar-type H+-ATPase subunit K